MEFFIVRDSVVTFSGPPTKVTAKIFERTSTSALEAEIQATDHFDGTDNRKYSGKLTAAIIKNPWTRTKKDFKIDWNLQVSMAIAKYTEKDLGVMRVFATNKSDYLTESFLKIVRDTFKKNDDYGKDDDPNVTMNVEVKNFGLATGSGERHSWKFNGLVIKENWRERRAVECSQKPFYMMKMGILQAWELGQKISGTFTISLVLNNNALNLLHLMNQDPKGSFEHFRKMLEKEICTDLEIHVGRQGQGQEEEGEGEKVVAVVKCHRAFLAAESWVFRRMFESGLNKIEIKEMSEKGVRAMLGYLYYRDIKAVYESCEIALELLQAAERYGFDGLKNSVREFMMAKESAWFEVEMMLKLFEFVRDGCCDEEDGIYDKSSETDKAEASWKGYLQKYDLCCLSCEADEDHEELERWRGLMRKCHKVLRWYLKMKPGTLLGSDKYHQIFGGNLNLQTKITSEILRLDLD